MELPRRTPNDNEKMIALVQLAGTVAHELNNIFTAVAGNLSLLDQEFSDEQSVTYRDILRAAQRGIDLTSKLQAFAGRQRLERRSIELNGVVSRTLAKLRNTLDDIAVDITLAGAEFIVYADEQKLSDTVIELIKNARAAMSETGGRLTVKTERIERGGNHPYATFVHHRQWLRHDARCDGACHRAAVHHRSARHQDWLGFEQLRRFCAPIGRHHDDFQRAGAWHGGGIGAAAGKHLT